MSLGIYMHGNNRRQQSAPSLIPYRFESPRRNGIHAGYTDYTIQSNPEDSVYLQDLLEKEDLENKNTRLKIGSPGRNGRHWNSDCTVQSYPEDSIYLQVILEKEHLEKENRRLKIRITELLRENRRELRCLELSSRENFRILSARDLLTQDDKAQRIHERYERSLKENAELERKIEKKEDEFWCLRGDLLEMESKIRSEEDLLAKRENDIRQIHRQLQEAQRENKRLTLMLNQKERDYVSLWESFDVLRNENKDLKEREHSIRFADDRKSKEIVKLKGQFHMNMQEKRKIEEDLKQASDQCKMLSLENNRISKTLSKLEEEIKSLRQEKDTNILRKRNTLYRRMSGNNEIDETENSLWVTRFTEMQNELHVLRNEKTTFEEEKKTLRKQAAKDRENFQRELDALRKLNKDLEEELVSFRRQYPNLSMDTKVNDTENLKQELATMKKRNNDLEEDHRRFLQERNDIRLLHSNALDRLEDEVSTLKKSMHNKETEIKSLQSKLIDAERARAVIPKTSEYHLLHEESRKLKKEKSSLEKLLEDCLKSFEEMEMKQKDSNTSLLQVEKQNKELKDELSKMKKEAEYPRYAQHESKDNEKLQVELRKIGTENQTYQQRISTLQQERTSALARYEKAESKIGSMQGEILQKQTEIQSLQDLVRQKETENSRLQQQILMGRESALERRGDFEKELIQKNINLQENVKQLRSELIKYQEENARLTTETPGKTEQELNFMKKEEQRLLKRNSQLESENSNLREKIETISTDKDKDLTIIRKAKAKLKNSEMEVHQKVKEIQELQGRILQKEGEMKRLREELSDISKGRENSLKRKDVFEQENRHLRESLNKLHAEKEISEEKIRSTTKMFEETGKQLKSMEMEIRRLQDRVTQLASENNQLREDIAEVSKEKDNALTRLSKVAGAKLTHGNAAITDLSDTNRPTKIAEKFSELYDNQWTDAFEELDNTYNNEEETIQVLLKILQEAYTFCVQTETNYETRIGQAVFTLADEKTNEFRQITETDVPVQKALTDLRLSLGNACCSIMEEMFLARLPSILKMVDVSVSPKTKLYARQCASLCWRMRIRDPPVFVRFEFRGGTEFNTDILRRYTKTGGYLDFIVWPALYLHENGPVLSKGVAQPKHSP